MFKSWIVVLELPSHKSLFPVRELVNYSQSIYFNSPDASPYGMHLVVPGCVQIKLPIDSTNLVESSPSISSLIDFFHSINISDAHFIRADANNIAVVFLV